MRCCRCHRTSSAASTAQWLDERVLEITLSAPPTNFATLTSGNDYAIRCKPGAPPRSSSTTALILPLPRSAATRECLTPRALRSPPAAPGSLPSGPTISWALADDPDDADASPYTLSVGDIVVLNFSTPTSMPTPITGQNFVFLVDGAARDLGEWVGDWVSPSQLNLTLAAEPSGLSTLPTVEDLSARFSIQCAANSNITAQPLRAAHPPHSPAARAAPPPSPSPATLERWRQRSRRPRPLTQTMGTPSTR